VKKIIIALAIIAFVLMNTVSYLILYKKYNDMIDYFNQDSQLTAERLEGLDKKFNDMKTVVDQLTLQVKNVSDSGQMALDDKLKSTQDRVELAITEIRKELSSRIDALRGDLAAIRDNMSPKQAAGTSTKPNGKK